MTIDPTGPLKPRGDTRTRVSAHASLRQAHWYAIEVKVCDVSSTGFKAECPQPVRIGGYVSLDVPGIGPVNAQVRWQIGGRMGGLFLDPISLAKCEWTARPAEPPAQAA